MDGSGDSVRSKDEIRGLHNDQRRERAQAEYQLLQKHGQSFLNHFAAGSEVDPRRIKPKLVRIEKPDSLDGYLFRIATLLWSVPVSKGYGRRLRYLVIDQSNGKLMGLMALGDPVFNLACRDKWIGWNVRQREERLSFMLDAYVLGAMPPYSMMLGGKLIAALVAANEIGDTFRAKYGARAGIISQRTKDPRLVLVTTTSALGRSSVYNRLNLHGLVNFQSLGFTGGWGHFKVPNELFKDIRSFLQAEGNRYYNNYEFRQGPNWRLRAIREAASLLGIEEDILRHGVLREVFGVPLTSNWRQILTGLESDLMDSGHCADAIAEAALRRWVIPRAEHSTLWTVWTRGNTWEQMTGHMTGLPENSL